MLEQIAPWIAAPLFVLLSLTAVYRGWILPNYEKDMNDV